MDGALASTPSVRPDKTGKVAKAQATVGARTHDLRIQRRVHYPLHQHKKMSRGENITSMSDETSFCLKCTTYCTKTKCIRICQLITPGWQEISKYNFQHMKEDV